MPTPLEHVSIAELRDGNAEVFNEVYDICEKPVFRLCYYMLNHKEDAEDATAEVFIKLWRSRVSIQDARHLEGFLVLVSRNHCLDVLRKRKGWKKHFIQMPDDVESRQNLPIPYASQSIVYEELEMMLLREMAMLTERQQQVLELKMLGYKTKAIAQWLGVGANAVYDHWAKIVEAMGNKAPLWLILFITALLLWRM